MASEPDRVQDPAETSLVSVSESRVRVLKALGDGRRTVSELARELDLNKSTLHGYLNDLVDDGFVERHEDDERLWVYYSLSAAGESLVKRDKLKLVVDLGTIAAFLGTAAIGLHELVLTPEPASGPGTLAEPSDPATGLPWKAIAYVVLAVLVLAGLGLHLYLDRSTGGGPA